MDLFKYKIDFTDKFKFICIIKLCIIKFKWIIVMLFKL